MIFMKIGFGGPFSVMTDSFHGLRIPERGAD